ncbi:hypothetical protein [Methanosarcina acetivorans]|nr:hypothetical protein [Methanosarcina acetivorans]
MYVKTICPVCRNPAFHQIALLLETSSQDPDSAAKYAMENIEVRESVAAEDFVRDVLCTIREYLHDGITTRELCRILKKYYGIATSCCCDLVQRIKIELDMYSPDRRHLYFVSP